MEKGGVSDITLYIYTILELTEISKSFDSLSVLRDISFSVNKGQTLCLIGPSGSGKSTILKIINGLIAPTSGKVKVFGQEMNDLDPVALRRKIGFVLQQPALFPHYTVSENIEVVPKLLKTPTELRKKRTVELLDLLHLPADRYAERFPYELSGGEQQRVGIARALAADPELILFDEPFSALDPITRTDLQQEVLRLKEQLRKTAVFVTHDVGEAFLLGDRVIILHEGRIVRQGSPEEIKANPESDFVERFIKSQGYG